MCIYGQRLIFGRYNPRFVAKWAITCGGCPGTAIFFPKSRLAKKITAAVK